MKKLIDTSTVQYTKYDKKCPFDTAASIIDWLDGMTILSIRDVASQFHGHNLLNEFGNEVYEAIQLMTGSRARNEGVPKKTLAFYKRYDDWVKKNKNVIDVKIPILKRGNNQSTVRNVVNLL